MFPFHIYQPVYSSYIKYSKKKLPKNYLGASRGHRDLLEGTNVGRDLYELEINFLRLSISNFILSVSSFVGKRGFFIPFAF